EKPGKFEGVANAYLKVSEFSENAPNNNIANFSDDITWFAYIQDLKIEILINNDPVGQQEYYLGQKINLSYRLRPNKNNYFKLENPVWEISGPKLKKYNLFVAGGKQAAFLSDQELATETVSLFLYCLEKENYEKQIEIQGTIMDKQLNAITSIKVKHPQWVDPVPPEIPDPVLNSFTDDSYEVAYLGYKEESENEYPVFNPTIKNDTKIEYLVAALQLVKNNHWRKLEGVDGVSEEVAVTKPPDEMWLDKQFPYLKHKLCPSNDTTKIEAIYEDLPLVELISSYNNVVKEVKTNAEYILFFMVKPSGNSMPYDESIWVPLNAFYWQWQGRVKRNDEKWEVTEPLIGKGFMKIDYNKIIQWNKVAIVENENEDENHIIIKWEPKP
ncbi:MAG: hypothetical protein ACQETH_14500, partial [Candidatus Rifleibacteriota bacterium]